jgi:hypothetical protein
MTGRLSQSNPTLDILTTAFRHLQTLRAEDRASAKLREDAQVWRYQPARRWIGSWAIQP